MNNTKEAKIFNEKSDSTFFVAAISLTLSSLMLNFSNSFSSDTMSDKIMFVLCAIIMAAASITAYVMTIKGFGIVKKSCMLDDKNENYYLGRNLQRLSIATIGITIILTVAAFFVSVLAAQYANLTELSEADYQAYGNLLVIVAVISIVMMIFDITLPYMIYLWKTHKICGGDNFALLTVIIMVVQIIIASLNSIYSARGGDNSFLSSFSVVLEVIERLALMLFFLKRKQKKAIVTE